MRRFFIIQALFWGIGLCLGAQNLSVSVGEPKVTPPQGKDNYKAVKASDLLHATEGSSAKYEITVTGTDSITSVTSLTYNNTDLDKRYYVLENGKLTIHDIPIDNLKASDTPFHFSIKLTYQINNPDTTSTDKIIENTLTAEAPLNIMVWPEPQEPELSVTTNSEENPEKIFWDDTWKLEVNTPAGGFADGWIIKCNDVSNGNVLSVNDKGEYEVNSSGKNEMDKKHIQLQIVNYAPDRQTKWFEDIYDYYIDFYPVPEVQFAESYHSNVLDEEEIIMAVKFADNNQEGNYTLSCDWENDGALEHIFKASNTNKENGDEKEVKVTCTIGLKGILNMSRTQDLSHTFTVWPQPHVGLSDGPYNDDNHKLLFQDGELKISIDKKGGYRDGWRFLWKDENNNELSRGTEYTIQCDPSDEIVNKHVSLTVINQAEGRDEPWLTKPYDYYVSFYPTPIVKFDKIYPKNIQNDSTVTMTLVIQNANGTPSDDYVLKCSWPDESNGSTYEFTGNNKSDYDGVQDTITVIVEANLNGTELTHEDSLSYVITTWPNPVVNADGLTDYVGCGGQTKDFHVTSTGGRKDGWTYDWYKNGTIIGQGTSTFTLDLKNDDVDSEPIEDKDSVRVKNISDGDEWFSKVYLFSVTIYPKPRVPDTITLTDGNRGQEITKGIREGNDIGLYCDKCLGGNPDAWTYSWNCDNREIGAERQLDTNVSANYTGSGKDNTDVTYSCYVQNLYYGSPWEEKRYDKTITVYRKPQTPTGLTRKGNGTSGTLIATTSVSDTDLEGHEYYLVFGYIDANGQMHDAMSQRQQNVGEVRWSTQISSSEMNSPSNTLYVYALWKYSDGAEITSGLRQLNSVDERWDGSSYDGSTRSVIANATAISNIEHGEDAITPHEYYMTNGMKSQGLSKGLNVIRMSDGTVKKMIVK